MVRLKMIVKISGCLAILAIIAIFTFNNFNSLKSYFDKMTDYSSYGTDELEYELRKENMRAMENEREYKELIDDADKDSGGDNDSDGRAEEGEEGIGNQSPYVGEQEEAGIGLHALSAVLLDAANNRVLYKKNAFKEMPMASTTKIMTCIVTLENAELSDIVTVSSYAARMPDVQLNIRTGEQYYLKDLLYSLMLESHNDVAVAIAEHVGGSVEGFSTMMNDKARSLGCNNTNFVTPNGLDAAGHYTTARDLAVITAYAIKNKKFIEITNTSSYRFSELINRRSFTVSNKNKFLYMMEGAIGVKTGFTGEAGYCFVGAIKREDRTLISVVLGCGWPPNKSLKWKDTTRLMNYGIDNYKIRQIFEDVRLAPVQVDKGVKSHVDLRIDGELSLLMRDDETVNVVYEIPVEFKAPVHAYEEAGCAKYYIDNMLYAQIPIYTAEEIKRISLPFCIDRIIDYLLIDY